MVRMKDSHHLSLLLVLSQRKRYGNTNRNLGYVVPARGSRSDVQIVVYINAASDTNCIMAVCIALGAATRYHNSYP